MAGRPPGLPPDKGRNPKNPQGGQVRNNEQQPGVFRPQENYYEEGYFTENQYQEIQQRHGGPRTGHPPQQQQSVAWTRPEDYSNAGHPPQQQQSRAWKRPEDYNEGHPPQQQQSRAWKRPEDYTNEGHPPQQQQSVAWKRSEDYSNAGHPPQYPPEIQKALTDSLLQQQRMHKIIEDMVKNNSANSRTEPANMKRPDHPRREEDDDEDEAMSYQSGGRPGGPSLTQHNVKMATHDQYYPHQTEGFGEEIPKADRTRGGPVSSNNFPPLQSKGSQKRGPTFSQQSTSSAREQDRMALGKFKDFTRTDLITLFHYKNYL
jgi:hypothetical protein